MYAVTNSRGVASPILAKVTTISCEHLLRPSRSATLPRSLRETEMPRVNTISFSLFRTRAGDYAPDTICIMHINVHVSSHLWMLINADCEPYETRSKEQRQAKGARKNGSERRLFKGTSQQSRDFQRARVSPGIFALREIRANEVDEDTNNRDRTSKGGGEKRQGLDRNWDVTSIKRNLLFLRWNGLPCRSKRRPSNLIISNDSR